MTYKEENEKLKEELKRLREFEKMISPMTVPMFYKSLTALEQLQQKEQELKEVDEWIEKLKKEVFEGNSKVSGRLQREGEEILTKNKEG